MKKQILIISGGDTFETYEEYLKYLRNCDIHIERFCTASKGDWKPWLREALGDEYEVIIPPMPNKSNAKFEEWKIVFEKLFPFLNDEVILIGHSLGASFLVKYVSENAFPKKIKGVFLVSGCFDKDTSGYSLADFSLPKKLKLSTKHVYLYHSKDDPVVPFSDVEKFKEAFPESHVTVFEDRGHINQEDFFELAQDIRIL